MTLALAWLVGLGLVAACVAVHHRALVALRRLARSPAFRPHAEASASAVRPSAPGGGYAVVLVLALFAAHVVEAQLFGAAMYAAHRIGLGDLEGGDGTLVEYLYFSVSTYTSLGMGDLAPVGHLRLLAGLEALMGLLLIGWSASFLFNEHRALWPTDADRARSEPNGPHRPNTEPVGVLCSGTASINPSTPRQE